MRRRLMIMAVGLLACACIAGPEANYREITLGTNTTGTATLGLSGYVEAVYVGVDDGESTGAVTIAYAPLVGSTAINIATNIVTDELVWRPAVDMTDVLGAALTSDPPARFALAGETVTITVTGTKTGLVWQCLIVVDDD